MSKKSDAVKKWRKTCKERIAKAMGGSCCVCGYNLCIEALALHHLDPTKKDFAISSIRANPASWDNIVVEIRKCVLVCHNCHNEIHYGLAVVPNNAPRFDERFANYKDLLIAEGGTKVEQVYSPCPVCNVNKLAHQKYCSAACSARSKYRVEWDKIDLATEIKTKSVVQISEEIGCSDVAVRKRMKKLGIDKNPKRQSR